MFPLGFTGYRDGEVRFRIRDIENLPVGVRVVSGCRNRSKHRTATCRRVRVNLPAGDYNNRFSLAFLKSTTAVNYPDAT